MSEKDSEKDEEFNVYKQVYEFAAKEVSGSRNTFEKYYKNTIWAMLIIATAAIGAFFYLFGQKYTDLEATAARKTEELLIKLHQQIIERVDKEFKDEKMVALIRKIAQEQTKLGLSDVITRAVGDQVQAAIKAETPKIQQTVIQETKRSVSELSPTIDKIVKEKTGEAESRIQSRLSAWEEILNAGNLAILARNGSGVAYDQLVSLIGKTKNPQVKEICISTHNQLFIELNSQVLYPERHFIQKKTEQELLTLIDDPNPLIRRTAIDEFVKAGKKGIVPMLLLRAEKDPFMVVRQAAFHGLRVLTGEKIEALQIDEWLVWWEKNKDAWPPKR